MSNPLRDPLSPLPTATTIEKKGSTLIAHTRARSGPVLDEEDCRTLTAMIDQEAGAASGVSLVVIDLSAVQGISSLGLGSLVQISNKCKSRDQQLKLAAVTPKVRQVLSITRLDRMFDMVATVEAAVG